MTYDKSVAHLATHQTKSVASFVIATDKEHVQYLGQACMATLTYNNHANTKNIYIGLYNKKPELLETAQAYWDFLFSANSPWKAVGDYEIIKDLGPYWVARIGVNPKSPMQVVRNLSVATRMPWESDTCMFLKMIKACVDAGFTMHESIWVGSQAYIDDAGKVQIHGKCGGHWAWNAGWENCYQGSLFLKGTPRIDPTKIPGAGYTAINNIWDDKDREIGTTIRVGAKYTKLYSLVVEPAAAPVKFGGMFKRMDETIKARKINNYGIEAVSKMELSKVIAKLKEKPSHEWC